MGRTGVCVAFLLLAVVSCACVPPVAGADGNHGSYEQTDSFQTRSALGRSDAASDDGFRTHTNSVSTNDDRAPGVRALLKTTKQNTKARPDFNEGVYRTKGDVFDEVKAIVSANPHTMRLDTVQSTRGGYSSELVVVTVELGGLSEDDADEQGPPGREGGGVGVHNEAGARVGDARGSNAERSNNLPNTKKKIEKTRVLYNYGEHGRELITVEVAVDLLRAFALGLEHAAQLAHPDSSRSVGQTVKALVATVFKIVPMENVNGRELVEKGDFCERKNGRGVDCNRNWEVDWGVKAPDYDPSEEYPGTGPFSEPEAFMMRALLEEFNPHVWVNVHSGMEALFMPFDHKPVEPVGEGADAMRQILHKINTQSCGDRCVVGGGGGRAWGTSRTARRRITCTLHKKPQSRSRGKYTETRTRTTWIASGCSTPWMGSIKNRSSRTGYPRRSGWCPWSRRTRMCPCAWRFWRWTTTMAISTNSEPSATLPAKSEPTERNLNPVRVGMTMTSVEWRKVGPRQGVCAANPRELGRLWVVLGLRWEGTRSDSRRLSRRNRGRETARTSPAVSNRFRKENTERKFKPRTGRV